MDERKLQIRVGFVAILALIITVVLVMVFSDGLPFWSNSYTVRVKFPQAAGVRVSTPVRMNGVLIGRVAEVELVENGVQVTCSIDAERTLQSTDECVINTASVLGDAVLEFVSKPQDPSSGDQPRLLTDGDVIAGTPSSDPLEALSMVAELKSDIRGALGSINSAATQVAVLSKTFNRLVGDNDDQARRILNKTEGAIETFETAMQAVNQVAGDDQLQQELRRALQGLPQVFDEIRKTLRQAQTTLENFDEMAAAAKMNLDNLEGLTRPLGDRGPEIVAEVEQAVGNADILLGQLAEFGKALNDPEGSVGKLVYDDELYQRINRAVVNAESATRRIGPIIEDVRIFTDKISRDPSQLGVRGALNRQPSGFKAQNPPPDIMWRRRGHGFGSH